MNKALVTVLAVTLPLFMAHPAMSAPKKKDDKPRTTKLYRFVNEQGRTVIDDTVPIDLAKRGYEIVDPMGRVIGIVPPALTEEQKLSAREARQKEQELKEQQARDLHLLRHYTKVSDLEITRDRVLREIEFSIKIVEGNLLAQQERIVFQQRKAADLERAGRPVPKDDIEMIEQLNQAILHSEEDLVIRQKEYDEAEEAYAKDIARLETLLEERRKRYGLSK